MARFPLFCRLFGHKFISVIYTNSIHLETPHLCHLYEPVCKRCGIRLDEIGFVKTKQSVVEE